MSSLIRERQLLLIKVADLRAQGTPWPEVAAELAVEHETLRRLVSENHSEYDRFARWAKREFKNETMAQVLAKLRGLLRSSDDRIVFLASTAIIGYELARIRQGLHRARNKLRKDNERFRNRVSHLAQLAVTAESTRCDSELPAT